MNESIIKARIKESIDLKSKVLNDEKLIEKIDQITSLLVETFRNGGGVYFCGNGGSAADAQHISAELSGRFLFDRKPLRAEALHVNSSFITAVSNDWDFNETYSRAVEAFCKRGDIVFGLTTSGKSKNVLFALKKAKELGCTTIGMTGLSGMEIECDITISIPSQDTARIQECHLLIGHIISELVEKELFG